MTIKAVFARRRFLSQLAGMTAGGLLATRGAGRLYADDTARDDAAADNLLDKATQKQIDRGLEFLAGAQRDDGSFGASGYAGNVAVCALAGIAFLASGSTPDRGPYGKHVSRCVEFILSKAADSGFISVPGDTSHGPMYGHGFAALFLAETNGMADVREKLSKAIELIVSTQNSDGGWRYLPQRQPGDISVTVCQVMALRAAGNSGLHVPRETLEKSVDYIKRSQNADGGFAYMLQGGVSAFPRSAAGIMGLYSAGVFEGPEIKRGLEYLMAYLPRGPELNRESHYLYGHYYAVQAMWQAGGDYWKRWYPAIRDAMLARQREDGAWMDSIGAEYGTAMAGIILQMPNNYLPIFQR